MKEPIISEDVFLAIDKNKDGYAGGNKKGPVTRLRRARSTAAPSKNVFSRSSG